MHTAREAIQTAQTSTLRYFCTIAASVLYFSVAVNSVAASGLSSEVVFVAEAISDIKIDGSLDEPCWDRALNTTNFCRIYDKSTLSQPQTSFKVLFDEKKLYWGITGEEPDMERVELKEFERDSWPKGSSVEIFIDTNLDRVTYIQFATNLTGSIFDSCSRDASWNADWEVEVDILDDKWIMEIAVPFADLGLNKPGIGEKWGLNICRNREGGLNYSSTWAPVNGNFHSPEYFNDLIFGGFSNWKQVRLREFSCAAERYETFILNKSPKEELVLSRIKMIRKMITEAKKKVPDGESLISDILPLYDLVLEIGNRCRDTEAELKAVKAILEFKGL